MITFELDDKSVTYYHCDLSDEAEIRAVCARVREEIGHPTVLGEMHIRFDKRQLPGSRLIGNAVNNAGLCRGRTVAEGSYHDTTLTIKTNLLAPFLLTKEFLPHMIQLNHGHVVSVASMSAYCPPAGIADYAASKAGLVAFHEVRCFLLLLQVLH